MRFPRFSGDYDVIVILLSDWVAISPLTILLSYHHQILLLLIIDCTWVFWKPITVTEQNVRDYEYFAFQVMKHCGHHKDEILILGCIFVAKVVLDLS